MLNRILFRLLIASLTMIFRHQKQSFAHRASVVTHKVLLTFIGTLYARVFYRRQKGLYAKAVRWAWNKL